MTYDDVLGFWFSDATQPLWFDLTPAFDETIRQRFGALYVRAVNGELAPWCSEPLSALALVIVLDQFPRNMFRNDAHSFASDPQALAVARQAVDRGFDRALGPNQHQFLYMPFMHAENLADQEISVRLFTALGNANNLDFAVRHRDIVARFGRFPHRNALLGRRSTPEELASVEIDNPF